MEAEQRLGLVNLSHEGLVAERLLHGLQVAACEFDIDGGSDTRNLPRAADLTLAFLLADGASRDDVAELLAVGVHRGENDIRLGHGFKGLRSLSAGLAGL